MTDASTMTLPYPPTGNHWKMPVVVRGRSRLILTKAARDYMAAVREALAGTVTPLDGPVYLRVVAYRPRRVGDLDNILKSTQDALAGIAYADDKQIVSLYLHRRDDKHEPRLEVEVGRAEE